VGVITGRRVGDEWPMRLRTKEREGGKGTGRGARKHRGTERIARTERRRNLPSVLLFAHIRARQETEDCCRSSYGRACEAWHERKMSTAMQAGARTFRKVFLSPRRSSSMVACVTKVSFTPLRGVVGSGRDNCADLRRNSPICQRFRCRSARLQRTTLWTSSRLKTYILGT